MKRLSITPRKDWIQKVEEQGFLFYDLNNYYNEQTAYEFMAAEIAAIEEATATLSAMCHEVVDHVIKKKLYRDFLLPEQYEPFFEWSWKEDMPSFYGRFDLVFNKGEIKLLEFNADTPTSLLEASVIQWYWLQEYNREYDQFNSLHEQLVAHMKACKEWLYPGPLFFSSVKENTEDFMTVKYLQDCAEQAGIQTDFIYLEDIGVNERVKFTTANGDLIPNIFKLYPWEWLFAEEFGPYLSHNREQTLWIEPPYKAILSNKMLLVYLYQLFPNSPYLLPTYFGDDRGLKSYVKKPVFSREGANVSIVEGGRIIEDEGGHYGREGFIYQQYFPLPQFDGNNAVIGSWVVGGNPAGMGIRESSNLITNNWSRFCPHYFR